ncbi:MAG: ABC transporter substrate-binding protein [Candidatus Humimicrobiaceae bacterium]
MKKSKLWVWLLVFSVLFVMILSMLPSCKKTVTTQTTAEAETTAAPTTAAAETTAEKVSLTTIKIGLSPYQDVASLIVADKKGIFEKYGLKPEFISIGWGDAPELLASESVDFANFCDTDIAGKYENIPNIIFSNLLYLWEANCLIAQKDTKMKTFDEFKSEGMADEEAAKAACLQISEKAAVVARKTGQEAFLRDCASFAGLDYDKDVDPYIIDMQTEEGLPVFIKGEGDLFLPGIPQIQKLTTMGYPIIIKLTNIPVPGMVLQSGFGTYKKFAKNNFDTVVKFQAVIFDTIEFIEKNPDEGFKIISDYVNAQAAADMTPEALRDLYWNKVEFFPLAEESYNLTMIEGAPRYWEARWKQVFEQFKAAGTIKSVPDMSEVNLWPKVMNAYLEQYNPDLYKKLVK